MKTLPNNTLTNEERSKLLLQLLLHRLGNSAAITHSLVQQLNTATEQGGQESKSLPSPPYYHSLCLAFERLRSDIRAIEEVLHSPATEVSIDSDSPLLLCFNQEEVVPFLPRLSLSEGKQFAALLV